MSVLDPNWGEEEPPASAEQHPICLRDHPRATRQIEMARSWTAIAAFILVGWLSAHAGVPWFDAGVRALLAGSAGYVVAWALAIAVWRHLALAEADAARQAAEARRDARFDQLQRGAEAQAPASTEA